MERNNATCSCSQSRKKLSNTPGIAFQTQSCFLLWSMILLLSVRVYTAIRVLGWPEIEYGILTSDTSRAIGSTKLYHPGDRELVLPPGPASVSHHALDTCWNWQPSRLSGERIRAVFLKRGTCCSENPQEPISAVSFIVVDAVRGTKCNKLTFILEEYPYIYQTNGRLKTPLI